MPRTACSPMLLLSKSFIVSPLTGPMYPEPGSMCMTVVFADRSRGGRNDGRSEYDHGRIGGTRDAVHLRARGPRFRGPRRSVSPERALPVAHSAGPPDASAAGRAV